MVQNVENEVVVGIGERASLSAHRLHCKLAQSRIPPRDPLACARLSGSSEKGNAYLVLRSLEAVVMATSAMEHNNLRCSAYIYKTGKISFRTRMMQIKRNSSTTPSHSEEIAKTFQHQPRRLFREPKLHTTCLKVKFTQESKRQRERDPGAVSGDTPTGGADALISTNPSSGRCLVCASDSPAGEMKIGIESRCPKMSMCRSTSCTFRIILGTRKILLNACRFSDKATVFENAGLMHMGQVCPR